jgi:hypothetical protein
MTRADPAISQEFQGALDAALEFATTLELDVGRFEGSILNSCFVVHGPPVGIAWRLALSLSSSGTLGRF